MGKELYYPKWKKTGKPMHRDIAQKFYNREIEDDEEVHHIDGDPFHFEHCNLVIIKKRDHEILSKHMMENEGINYPKFKHWKKKKNNKNEGKTDDFKICNNCKHENKEEYSFCIECGNKF